MKNAMVTALLALLLMPVSATALEVDDLLAVAAMPLAVAAVAEVTDVPANDLINVISAMNRAQVPAPQFIEVVRYVPVALVETGEPRFTTYVTDHVDRGIRGEQLALAMEDRIETYGVSDIDVARAPSVVLVDDRDFVPPVVLARYEPVRYDPLSLVAMPLAVAAVSELAGVPPSDLASFVTLLNRAAVPPPQFVEIVRYVPVALADPRVQPQFMTYVTQQVDDGMRGVTLARLIEDRIEVLGVDEIDVVAPGIVTVVDREYVPPVVVRHVADARSGHPHGGPPGQLKKELGLQTGAEVVHGQRGVGTQRDAPRAARRSDDRPSRVRTEQPRRTRAAKADRSERRRETRAERPRRENRSSARPAQREDRVRPSRAGGRQKSGGAVQSKQRPAGRVVAPTAKGAGGGAAAGNAGGGKGRGKGKGNRL